MNDFLTVEDINTINVNNIVNEMYCIDTKLLGFDEYNDVQYDFVKISHSIINDEHKFTFEIHDKIWSREYCFVNDDETAFQGDHGYSNNKLYCVTPQSSIKLYIPLSDLVKSTEIRQTNICLDDNYIKIISKNEIGNSFKFNVSLWQPTGKITGYWNVTAKEGVVVNETFGILVLFIINKTDLVFDLNNVDLAVGSVNHVPLGVDSHYLPSGDVVDGDELDAVVIFNGEELPVQLMIIVLI